MTVTIYHNPACGTSRNTLAMIRQSGEEPEVIEYLKTPPSRARLVELIAAMGISPRELLREKGTPYAELGLADPKWSDDELIDFMLAHPILINRPIVVTPKGVRLCRPSELVLDLLDNPVAVLRQGGRRGGRAREGLRRARLLLVTIARHNRRMELTPRLRLMNWLVSQGLTGLPENDLIRGFCERCCAEGLHVSRGHGLHRYAAPDLRGPRLSLERRRDQRKRRLRIRLDQRGRSRGGLAELDLLSHARKRPRGTAGRSRRWRVASISSS